MKVLSLFDYTGYAVADFTKAGHTTFLVDTQHGNETAHPRATMIFGDDVLATEPLWVAWRPDLVLAFPPCTDLAVSGAKHFERKRRLDPNFQIKAAYLARAGERIAIDSNCPFAIENPISVLSTLWRKPDHIFHPYEYGGYLPEDDVHPEYPDYTPPRDAYPKRTCLWTGNGFTMPEPKPVPVAPGYSEHFLRLGGKSLKTKNIRSATPRGFARAVFEIYCR